MRRWPRGPKRPLPAQILSATPTLVAALNSILFAAIVALFAIQLGLENLAALAVGAAAFAAGVALHVCYGRRAIAGALGSYRPLFPSTEAGTI